MSLFGSFDSSEAFYAQKKLAIPALADFNRAGTLKAWDFLAERRVDFERLFQKAFPQHLERLTLRGLLGPSYTYNMEQLLRFRTRREWLMIEAYT